MGDTETRKIEVTQVGGFRNAYDTFLEGDVRVIPSGLAEQFVRNGWAKFVDGGPDVEVVGTPDNATLNVQNATHPQEAPNV